MTQKAKKTKAKKTKDGYLDELRGYFKSVALLVRSMIDTESQLGNSTAGKSLMFLRVEAFRVGLMIQGAISQLEKETEDIMATQDGRNEEKT